MAATIGGYGEYVITNLDECVRVPDVLTDEEASLFEPCGVVHSVIKQIVRPLDDVLILGQGSIRPSGYADGKKYMALNGLYN